MIGTRGEPALGPADAIDCSALDRVLIIMLRHHGDVLLTSPVIDALRQRLPRVEIDVVLYDETAPLLEHHPEIHQLFRIDRGWKEAGPLAQTSAEIRLLNAMSARRHQLIVHLSNHRRGAWLTRWLRPRWSVAARPRQPSRFWSRSFTRLYPNASSVSAGNGLARRHTVEQNLDALRRLGIAVDPSPRLRLFPGAEGERAASQFLATHHVSGPFILIQPTSRWMFKCWPVQQNVQLIRQLLAKGHTIVLSCGPDAREQDMIRAILSGFTERPQRLVLATEDATLPRLASLIQRARLFIGIDSAPMHIAAAMQTPLVALFGPSGESNWGPWRGDGALQFRVVTSTEFTCRPCGQDGCGGGKISLCLTRLPVSRVMTAVEELLGESELLFAS
jgi:heptosyltransferase-3